MSLKTGGLPSGNTRSLQLLVDVHRRALDFVGPAGARHEVRPADFDASIGTQMDLGVATLDDQLAPAGDAQEFRLARHSATWGVKESEYQGMLFVAIDEPENHAESDALRPVGSRGHPGNANSGWLTVVPLYKRAAGRVHRGDRTHENAWEFCRCIHRSRLLRCQFAVTLLPLRTRSDEALMLILPEPSTT